MAIRDILIYGNPVLSGKAEPVERIDEDIIRLAEDMVETVHAAPGIGLAAPQVGVSKRLIVVDLSVGQNKDDLIILVNPEVVDKEGEVVCEEGCLSVPDIREKVARPYRVTVSGLNLEGETIEVRAEDMLTRVLCHEIDHLDGILFVEKLSPLKRKLIRKKLKMDAAAGKKA